MKFFTLLTHDDTIKQWNSIISDANFQKETLGYVLTSTLNLSQRVSWKLCLTYSQLKDRHVLKLRGWF